MGGGPITLDKALEQAQGKVCDFLAGTRLRLREIPLERAPIAFGDPTISFPSV